MKNNNDNRIEKDLKGIMKFIDDEYSIIEYIKDDCFDSLGHLRQLGKSRLLEMIQEIKKQ